MSFTSKYIITNSSGKTLLDFDLDFADITFRGQSILFSGSNQIDGFFIRPGLSADLSNTKGSSDIVRITGNFLDYIRHVSLDDSGVLSFTLPDDDATQTIKLTPANTASDKVVFDDYMTTAKAISSALYLSTRNETLVFDGNAADYLENSTIDTNGNIDLIKFNDDNVSWIKVNPKSDKTLQFNDGQISVKAFFSSMVVPSLGLSLTELNEETESLVLTDNIVTAASSVLPSFINEAASIKAISFDPLGETFSGFGQNITLNISGGNGVDLVYVKAGSVIDATNLKGSKDQIYFTGKWSDYTKSFDLSGNIIFTREIEIDSQTVTEQVSVSGGSVVATRDYLFFSDGRVATNDASSALRNNIDVSLNDVLNVDLTATTPLEDQTPPSLTTTTMTINENATEVGRLDVSEVSTIEMLTGLNADLFALENGVLSLLTPVDYELDGRSYSVNIKLTDLVGLTSEQVLTININDVNEAPVGVDIAAQTAVVAQAFSLDVTSSFSDVDANDTLTYSIVGDLPAGLTFKDGVISGTATADTAAASVTVTATDAAGLTASETFTINAVSAPVINAIEVKQGSSDIAKAGEELTITATVSESFALTLNDATPTMVVTLGANDVTATYASHDADAKTMTFTATAPTGDTTSVVVKSISLGASILTDVQYGIQLDAESVGQTDTNFTLDNTVATLTTDTLSTAENATAVGTIVTSESATVTLGEGDDSDLFTLTDGVLTLKDAQDFETDDTSLTVNFDLTDTAGNTSTDSVTVNVTNVNEAPVGVDIAAQTAVVTKAFSLDLTHSFSDVDANDTLTYSVDGDLPAGLTLVEGVISGTLQEKAVSAQVNVTATDALGLSVTTTFELTVVPRPILSSALSELKDRGLDVRSNIVLSMSEEVSAVSNKYITFTDNTETGYQGETKTNSFTIAADSDLITIDNDKGVIIINIDANFDLDLSSNYTLSIDDGAFVSTLSGLASATVADITFNTVTPTSGADALAGLGSTDQVGSKTNFFNTKWLADWEADTDTGNYSHIYLVKSGFNFIPVTDISNQDVIDSIGGDTEYYISFDGSEIDVVSLDFLMSVSDTAYEALSSADSAAYEIQISAAQGYMMNDDDGSLVESAQWVDIEGLGSGTPSGNVNSLAADVEAGNVFELDASTSDYVFVFSDQNPNGGDESVGAGIATNTDLAVFIDEFGADDVIYVDDAFNDADNINILEYEVFANGKGGEGTELYLGLSGGDGDPRLYVGLEGDTESTDEDGNADSTLDAVHDALGLDDSSIVITA